MTLTLVQFIENLAESGLMTAAEIAAFQDGLPAERQACDAQGLAKELVAAHRLTKYQAASVYQGKIKGLILGDYVVLDKLGQGGMGIVLKAEHRRMKRLAAIKTLPNATTPDSIRRFYREVEAAAKLVHPNIVTAYDASECNGIHYLVSEYVEGQDLACMIKQHGPLSITQAVDCIIQVARGLQYAHSKGIIHRDIKPGNLLLDREGRVKILDMGLALVVGGGGPTDSTADERLTTTGQLMGTCEYLAPEQAQDTHRADQRSDVYSLGCTLYRLLTGRPPYSGETMIQVLLAHRDSPIPRIRSVRPQVPDRLDAIYLRMVAKQPEQRYQNMAQVIADLEIFQSSNESPAEFATDQSNSRTMAAEVQEGGAVAVAVEAKPAAVAAPAGISFAERETNWNNTASVMAVRGPNRNVLLGIGGGAFLAVVVLGLVASFSGRDRARHASGEPPVSEPAAAVAPLDEIEAQDRQKRWADYKKLDVVQTNSIGMTLVLIPPGEFEMGIGDVASLVVAPSGEPKKRPGLIAELPGRLQEIEQMAQNCPKHHVKITHPFCIGMYEVTQKEFQHVMNDNPSSFKSRGEAAPVERVTWQEAADFCRRLSQLPEEMEAKREYHLPSEAEWEFACRAGTTGVFAFGDAPLRLRSLVPLEEHAWFAANAGRTSHPVGQKKPNAWGIHDMHGNVLEWCHDFFAEDYYSRSIPEDPPGPTAGALHVVRGGSWKDPFFLLFSAARSGRPPDDRSPSLGFRVVVPLDR